MNQQNISALNKNRIIVSAEEKKEKKEPKTSYERKSKQEEDKSKGKKGNPFRVLMGIIGKLLDKGWDSAEIVRYVKKETSFEPKTIRKCVKIVKDYNKGLKRESPEEKQVEEKSTRYMSPVLPGADLFARSTLRNVTAELAFDNAEEEWEREGVYSIKDDFDKRSTRELVDRLYYLSACKKYDPFSDNGPKGSLSSIDGQLSEIKGSLKKRGWAEDDLDCAIEVLKTDPYHPFEVTNRK